MKKWAILLILFTGLYHMIIAQVLDKKISLNYRKVPLSEVIHHLKKEHQINFSYVNDFISLDRKVSIHAKNKPLQSVLEELFEHTDITYQIVGSQVVLKKSNTQDSKLKQTLLTQTIRGIVIDKALQTTLPGANIVLVNSTPFKGAASDAEGNFRLEKVPVGRQELRVSYTGYKDLVISNILVHSGKEVVLTIALEEQVIQGTEVVVRAQKDKSRAINELVVNSVASLRPDDINRFAGSRQDPSRMAGNYAGVESGDGQVNHIVVRGNSPRGLLWRMEGVDIINPNHFTFAGNTGGGFSIINNNLLSNSDFLTGAFPAEYGNKVSSVMDVQLRKGNNEKHEHTLQLGLNGLEYVAEGPISLKNGSSYLASIRGFDFMALSKIGVDLGIAGRPQFTDGTFKIHIPSRKAGNFSIWGIGGNSNVNALESTRDSSFWSNSGYATDEISRSAMYATGISHTMQLNARTFGKLVLASTGGKYSEELKDVAGHQTLRMYNYFRGVEGHHTAGYTLTHKLNSKHLFKGGINYRLVFFRQLGKFWLNDSVSVSFIDHRGNSSLMQSFFHWQYRAGEKLELNSGLYSQLFLLNKTKSVEPRFSVNYQLSKNQRISFAYGLHSQIHPLQYYFTQLLNPETGTYTLENKNLDMTRSQHWVVGYTHLFNDRLQLKTEVYYQYLSDVPVSLEQGNGFFSMLTTGGDNALWLANGLINKGTGRNYGIEFTAERYFNKDFYFLATASLFDSRYRGMDGILRHTPFSIGHITNLLAGKEFKLDEGKRKVISVDMKACFLGGRRYIPVNMDSTIEARRLVLDVSRAYEEKLKSQLRFDFRISYNVNLPKVTHNVFVAADNLFGAKNMLNQYWNDKTQSIQKDYQIGLFPYCGYRIHF